MKTVEISELKRHLSRFLRRARGEDPAELYPALQPLLPPGLAFALLDQERGER